MDNAVVLKKIESLKFCVSRIEEKKPNTVEELKQDLDIQDIVTVNLERAVQLSVDIGAIVIAERRLKTSGTMAGCFRELERAGVLDPELSLKMQKAVGFRNISVHEYEDMDWDLVYDIITHHLSNFSSYIEAVKRALD